MKLCCSKTMIRNIYEYVRVLFTYLFVCLNLILSSYCSNSLAWPVVKLLELGNNSGLRFDSTCSRAWIEIGNWMILRLTVIVFYWAYHVFKHNLFVLIWTFQTLIIKEFLPGKKEKIKLIITLRQKPQTKIQCNILCPPFWKYFLPPSCMNWWRFVSGTEQRTYVTFCQKTNLGGLSTSKKDKRICTSMPEK
jgi:hypothetical protein